jgi:hypothetical protein
MDIAFLLLLLGLVGASALAAWGLERLSRRGVR